MMNYSKFAQVLWALPIIFVLNCFTANGMQRARNWRGRAVLMAQDPKSHEWNILLAHNVNGPDIWSDFSNGSQGGERGNVIASRSIREQTNNQYTIDLTKTRHYYKQSPAGDWFHFVSVPFMSGRDLYAKARNSIKDDFMWVPVSAILNKQCIIHPRRGQIMISQGVYNFLRHNLSDAINFLNKSATAAISTQVPMQPQASAAAGTAGAWGPRYRNHIYFYESSQPYYEFTNFYYASVNLQGQTWPTSEHFFQAQKFPTNAALQARIRNARSPRDAFNISREPANDQYKDPNWDTRKFQVMLEAVRAKFNQNPALKTALLNTDDAVLVEDAGKNDAIWGAGADYKGTNHLGRILMHVRDELKGKIPAGTSYNP